MDSSDAQSTKLSQGLSFKNSTEEAEIKLIESLAKLDINNDKNNTIQIPNKENQATNLTETELINMKRSIYLILMSSLDCDDCSNKLIKYQPANGFQFEACNMIIDCCMNEKTYLKLYGLTSQRLCGLDETYKQHFFNAFIERYSKVHLLTTDKLRNTAKLFAHLLSTDAIDWKVFQCVRITQEDTNSSSRIYLKIVFQELAEIMGIDILNQKLQDPDYEEAFQGVFPKDDIKNIRFSINFFTTIGLGGITTEMRKYLAEKNESNKQTQKED